jgi:hypothetical protein
MLNVTYHLQGNPILRGLIYNQLVLLLNDFGYGCRRDFQEQRKKNIEYFRCVTFESIVL